MSPFVYKINWFGLAGGFITLIVVAVSMLIPWWKITIGDNLLTANASPVNTNFNFLTAEFTVPMILAFNIVALLVLIASGVSMLIYSVLPNKSYSKDLLDFGYKKPLFTVIFFIIGLVVVTLILQAMLGIGVPLIGSTSTPFAIPFVTDVSITVFMSACFLWPFWLAIVAAGFCIAARLYHRKVATVPKPPQ